MSEDVFGGEELRFPVECHFKIITDGAEEVRIRLELALTELSITAPLVLGNQSVHGKYVTYNFDWTVHSRDAMTLIDKRLRAVEGVKLIL